MSPEDNQGTSINTPPINDAAETAPLWLETLVVIFRRAGVFIVLLGALTFALQGLSHWESLTRFYFFLGYSFLLLLSGYFCRKVLKDEITSHTLILLATCVAPLHFSQVGALIHALYQQEVVDLPGWMIVQTENKESVILAILMLFIVCIPTVMSGFTSALVAHANTFSVLNLISLSAILIPLRDPTHIFLIAVIVFLVTLQTDYRRLRAALPPSSKIELILRLILYSPVFIMIGRSLLYGFTDFLLGLVFGLIGIILFAHGVSQSSVSTDTHVKEGAGRKIEDDGAIDNSNLLIISSLLPISLSWLHFLKSITFNYSFPLLLQYSILSRFFVLSLIILLLSLYAKDQERLFRRLSALIALISTLVQLYIEPSIGTAILCVATGGVVSALAFTFRNPSLMVFGLLNSLIGILYHLKYALTFFEKSPWLALSALGLALLILSSALARYYKEMLSFLTFARHAFSRKSESD